MEQRDATAKLLVFLIVAVAMGLTGVGYLLGRHMAELELEDVMVVPVAFSPSANPAVGVVKSSEEEGASIQEPKPPTLLDICAVDWEYWRQAPLNLLANEVINRRSLFSHECREGMYDAIDARVVRDFIRRCQDQISERTIQELNDGCVDNLAVVRGYILRQLRLETDLSPGQMSVDELHERLSGGLLSLAGTSLAEINRNIEIAETLAVKDPSPAMAYKAKLINLLIKEIRYNEPTDPAIYDDLLAQAGETEVLHLPFLRLSALGDLNALRESALDFIRRQPDSQIGYLYLAEALWRGGDPTAALNVIQLGVGDKNQAEAYVLFSLLQRDPLERIYQLVDYR